MIKSLLIEKIPPYLCPDTWDGLAGLLQACVEDGASIGFLMPFSRQDALDYWKKVSPLFQDKSRALFIARIEKAIIGSVQIDFAMPANQPHRCEITKLMVHPTTRGQGIAKELIKCLELEARNSNRTLITLDTRTGDHGEYLYKSLGYHSAGVIPGYAQSSAGLFDDTTIFYKNL